MGEAYPVHRPAFNPSVQITFRESRLSSDGGALLCRDILDRMGIIDWMVSRLHDPRVGVVEHSLGALLRLRLLMLAQGWLRTSDIDHLREDPCFRLAASDRRGQTPLREAELPSRSTLSRLLAMLSSEENLEVLREAVAVSAGHPRAGEPSTREPVVLDVDSVPLEVHGRQADSAWNGQYKYRGYHPLVGTIGEEGELVGLWLRPGNAHTARGSDEGIPALVERVKAHVAPVYAVRFDAGFPSGHLFKSLDEHDIHFLARVKCNTVIHELAGWHTLPQLPPPTDAPRTRIQEFTYKAGSWPKAYRTVHVHIQEPGEVVARNFFLVTSLPRDQLSPEDVLALYRRRGLAEDAMGQWLQSTAPALSSTNRPKSRQCGLPIGQRAEPIDPSAANEAHLLLSAIAANLLLTIRRLAQEPDQPKPRLTSLRSRMLKVGARATLSGRRVYVAAALSARVVWTRIREAMLTWSTPEVRSSA